MQLPADTSSSEPATYSSALSTRETALVAGTTAGAIVLVFLLFAAIFLHMRGRRRERELHAEERRGKGAGGVGMLDGEEFADSVPQSPISISGSDESGSVDGDVETGKKKRDAEKEPRPGSAGRAAFLFPPRTSDLGSAFREEVWPPPRQESAFVDPLLQVRGLSAGEDLARIVTDVMGADGISSTTNTPTTVAAAASAVYLPAIAAASPPRQRRDSGKMPRSLREMTSTPTLPRSTITTFSGNSSSTTVSEDDPPWPPTPAELPVLPPPAAQTLPLVYTGKRPPRPNAHPRTRSSRQVRPSTGDGPYVKNWLERTPRRPGTAPGDARRSASESGHF